MTLSRVGVSVAIILSVTTGPALAADQIALPGTPYSIALPGGPECDAEPVKLPMGMDIPARCSVEVDGLKYTFDYMPIGSSRRLTNFALGSYPLGLATAHVDVSVQDKTKYNSFS